MQKILLQINRPQIIKLLSSNDQNWPVIHLGKLDTLLKIICLSKILASGYL